MNNRQLSSQRHRVFVSYYHTEDQKYRAWFERSFSDIYDIYVSESVKMGDIDDTKLSTERIHQIIRDKYLRQSTVAIVLVGAHTWQRKYVDWEIGSSLRQTEYNSRSGLLGILLPTHPDYSRDTYTPGIIPPRLHDNIARRFAKLYKWSDDPNTVQSWIHEAFLRRDQNPPPDNSRLNITVRGKDGRTIRPIFGGIFNDICAIGPDRADRSTP